MRHPMTFEQSLSEKVLEIRQRLQAIDTLPRFRIDIEIFGRVHEGEIDITFKLGQQYVDESSAEGGNLDCVVNEFMHRFGWKTVNNPLRIGGPRPEDKPRISLLEDEIPF
jgi:hypothetical protein